LTRLSCEIIKSIPASLEEADRALLRSTGHTLLDLAARTVQESCAAIAKEIRNFSAAVVPISSGAGVIPGFARGVAAILRHIGVNAVVTNQSDIAGISEAFNHGVDIFFAADDNRFSAFNLKNSLAVDNAEATAAGFVQALASAAEMADGGLTGTGLADQDVLVLGLGPVGAHAVKELRRLGSRVWVYDLDVTKLRTLSGRGDIRIAIDIKTAMRKIDYVLDATPAAGIIDEDMICSDTVISCPGVPHGLTPAALQKIGDRFIHDNLPLGVATMAVQCLFDS
jgi:pyrrolysine biosynthesis protein PylD